MEPLTDGAAVGIEDLQAVLDGWRADNDLIGVTLAVYAPDPGSVDLTTALPAGITLCSSSSAGPSELGTPIVDDAVALRLASFMMTQAFAYAENSRPPYCLGIIMPKKPCSFM